MLRWNRVLWFNICIFAVCDINFRKAQSQLKHCLSYQCTGTLTPYTLVIHGLTDLGGVKSCPTLYQIPFSQSRCSRYRRMLRTLGQQWPLWPRGGLPPSELRFEPSPSMPRCSPCQGWGRWRTRGRRKRLWLESPSCRSKPPPSDKL